MIYKKGQKFLIKHERRGVFYCEAKEDFNSESMMFYPLIDLYDGRVFVAKRTLCQLTPISDAEFQGVQSE